LDGLEGVTMGAAMIEMPDTSVLVQEAPDSNMVFGMMGRINLYTMGGALIQSWMTQDGSTTRTLTIPADVAAGVYILQVITKDGGYSRKVVVE